MRMTNSGDLEWLAPLSLLVSGISLAFIAYPATLEQSGLMDRELAAGLTTLFSIVLILPSLVFWAATVLISVGALVWGRRRLRGCVLLWYVCLATTLLLFGMEQRVAAAVACVGLAALVILPGLWLCFHAGGRKEREGGA